MVFVLDADQYYKQAPYNWVNHVLKFHQILEGENTVKPTNPQNTFVSPENAPGRVVGQAGIEPATSAL
jgi:hypothetical protein